MENIRMLLLKISDRLFKTYSLFGEVKTEKNDYVEKIKVASKEGLYRIAVDLLDYALTNNKFHSCKEYFNELYNLTVEHLSKYGYSNTYFVNLIMLYFKQVNYPVYLDGIMGSKDNKLFSNKLRVLVPETVAENITEEMYGRGGSIYENEDTIPMVDGEKLFFDDFDVLVYFGNGFEMDLSLYSKDSDNNLVTRKYHKDEMGKTIISNVICDEVLQSLCYTSFAGTKMFIETPELEYVRASEIGTNYDFIRMMQLKDKVNKKKIVLIKDYRDKMFEKKEINKSYGL